MMRKEMQHGLKQGQFENRSHKRNLMWIGQGYDGSGIAGFFY